MSPELGLGVGVAGYVDVAKREVGMELELVVLQEG
jgi:hypothetical protein